MAKLILSLENTLLNECELYKERTTIGRRPNNDIHIDNLAVSGLHAAVIKMGNDFYVEDQGSTNGTQVNAQTVKSHLLQHGDFIEFGKYQVKYVNEAAANNGDGGFEKTVMIRPVATKSMQQEPLETATSFDNNPAVSAEKAQPILVKPASLAPDTTAGVGRIQILNGSSSGRELVLNKALTTLGKPGMQVAVITKRPSGYFITHVEGQVQPIVNGSSIGAQAFALSDHDVIELAGVKMEFYLNS